LGDSVVRVVGVGDVVGEVVGAVDVLAVAAAEGVAAAGASVNVAAGASVGSVVVDGVLGEVAALAAGPAAGVVAGSVAGVVPGSGGRGGTVGAGPAVRATDDDSSFALLDVAPLAVLLLFGAEVVSAPGDHAGASPVAAGAEGDADVEAVNAGASLAAGGVAGAAGEALADVSMSPPISGDSSVHSPKPGGNAGSVSLIFMYKNTPTAASSVIVANGRRELTGSSS
jgi:hypothetical protein